MKKILMTMALAVGCCLGLTSCVDDYTEDIYNSFIDTLPTVSELHPLGNSAEYDFQPFDIKEVTESDTNFDYGLIGKYLAEKAAYDYNTKTYSGGAVENLYTSTNGSVGSVSTLTNVSTIKDGINMGDMEFLFPYQKSRSGEGAEVSVRITSFTGNRQYLGLATHNGTDLAVSEGTPIYASANGTVLHAGYGNGYGYVVLIEHHFAGEKVYFSNSAINIMENILEGALYDVGGNYYFEGFEGTITAKAVVFLAYLLDQGLITSNDVRGVISGNSSISIWDLIDPTLDNYNSAVDYGSVSSLTINLDLLSSSFKDIQQSDVIGPVVGEGISASINSLNLSGSSDLASVFTTSYEGSSKTGFLATIAATDGVMNLFIEHLPYSSEGGGKVWFMYAHLNSMEVGTGANVITGDPIATEGTTGGVASHLHLCAYIGGSDDTFSYNSTTTTYAIAGTNAVYMDPLTIFGVYCQPQAQQAYNGLILSLGEGSAMGSRQGTNTSSYLTKSQWVENYEAGFMTPEIWEYDSNNYSGSDWTTYLEDNVANRTEFIQNLLS